MTKSLQLSNDHDNGQVFLRRKPPVRTMVGSLHTGGHSPLMPLSPQESVAACTSD